MKQLMLGNQAVARGLYESDCKLISSYPGTPSTEITEEAAKYEDIYAEWAPNEKVAMETAFGASLSGLRSFCAMKHVGLNVAADPLFTISYTGVNAGMVIAVADDAGMHSSQNEQDSRHYAIAAKVPLLEPSDSREALEFTKLAYEISENFDTPVIIKMCTRVSHSQSIVELNEKIKIEKKEYKKDPAKYVMMPAYAKLKHPMVEKRTKDLIAYAENTPINKTEYNNSEIGVITSSTSYQYVKEALGNSVNILKLSMINPLPEKLIKDFAKNVKKLIVVEELDPVIENHCKNLGLKVTGKELFSSIGELSQNIIREKINNVAKKIKSLNETLPVRPPAMCAGCPHRGLFYVLSKNNLNVLGDIGCYTLGAQAPLSAMDSTVCMGSSVSSLHGFNKLNPENEKNSVAVIGDSTFMHSGMTSLANIAYNNSNSTVIILDNSITGMTGHQQNPTTGFTLKGALKNEPCEKINLEQLCGALGIKNVRVTDPYDLYETEKILKEELERNEPSVIISRRPCVLLKYVKKNTPLSIDKDKCRGCKSCMKIGCPAISIKNKKAQIDKTLCVGCNVCKQLCKFDAFTHSKEEDM